MINAALRTLRLCVTETETQLTHTHIHIYTEIWNARRARRATKAASFQVVLVCFCMRVYACLYMRMCVYVQYSTVPFI
jgi:hypothetical protein